MERTENVEVVLYANESATVDPVGESHGHGVDERRSTGSRL